MKNKDFQKAIIFTFILTIVFGICVVSFNYKVIKEYEYNNNVAVARIIASVKENYPDYDDTLIMEILNDDKVEVDVLRKYGVDLNRESIAVVNQNIINKAVIFNIVLLACYVLFIFLIITLFNRMENKKTRKITSYIEEINKKNYELDILSNSEDEMSLLKNEIYKTAVTLNEQARLLKSDKDTLKDSLSDISHQLKTPLTSITLMIDTLLDNKNLSEVKRKEILTNIHRKIGSINFLVYSLLKLSKFDANTVEFNDEYYCIKDIFDEVLDNLAVLSDLKDVTINVKGNNSDKLYCDYKWQVEAITNIVKNALEYSSHSSKIDISYSSNEVLTKIVIKDYGVGMDEYDRQHIFERFYKGKNSNSDSVGIGLALANMIVEKDNGYIVVDSKLGEGTTFTIKYVR